MGNQPLAESETVELKKSLAEMKQGLISIAAILNKHQAGTLWFGVRNDGTLYGNLTIEDLHKGNVSQRRNPLIADLFRRIAMVEAWGRGMPLILKYAPDVVFREVGNLFIVSFHRPSFLELEDQGEITAHETTQEKGRITKETTKKPQGNPRELILAVLKAQSSISIKELAVQCEMSVHSVQHHINKLKEMGVIRHVGPTKGGAVGGC